MDSINYYIMIVLITINFNISASITHSESYEGSSIPKDFKRHIGLTPDTNWEPGLREAVHQSLLKERVALSHLREKILKAPMSGQGTMVSPFGDVAILARGQLFATRSGFRFVQESHPNDCIDCHELRQCYGKECDIYLRNGLGERLIALWTVKRLRHRNPDVRYELEYSVSPIRKHVWVTKNGGYDYSIPGHVFVVRTGHGTVGGNHQSGYTTHHDKNVDLPHYPHSASPPKTHSNNLPSVLNTPTFNIEEWMQTQPPLLAPPITPDQLPNYYLPQKPHPPPQAGDQTASTSLKDAQPTLDYAEIEAYKKLLQVLHQKTSTTEQKLQPTSSVAMLPTRPPLSYTTWLIPKTTMKKIPKTAKTTKPTIRITSTTQSTSGQTKPLISEDTRTTRIVEITRTPGFTKLPIQTTLLNRTMSTYLATQEYPSSSAIPTPTDRIKPQTIDQHLGGFDSPKISTASTNLASTLAMTTFITHPKSESTYPIETTAPMTHLLTQPPIPSGSIFTKDTVKLKEPTKPMSTITTFIRKTKPTKPMGTQSSKSTKPLTTGDWTRPVDGQTTSTFWFPSRVTPSYGIQASVIKPEGYPGVTQPQTTIPIYSGVYEKQTTMPMRYPISSVFPESTQHGTTFPASTQLESTSLETTQFGSTFLGSTQPESIFLGSTQPKTSFPGTTQSGSTFPENIQLSSTFPGSTQPGSTFPESTQHGSTFPESTQHGSTFPESTQHGSTFPESKQPGSTFPESTQYESTFPGSKEPGSTFPGTTQLGSTYLASTQSSSTFPKPYQDTTIPIRGTIAEVTIPDTTIGGGYASTTVYGTSSNYSPTTQYFPGTSGFIPSSTNTVSTYGNTASTAYNHKTTQHDLTYLTTTQFGGDSTRPTGLLETTKSSFPTTPRYQRPRPTFFIDLTHPGYPKTTPTTPFADGQDFKHSQPDLMYHQRPSITGPSTIFAPPTEHTTALTELTYTDNEDSTTLTSPDDVTHVSSYPGGNTGPSALIPTSSDRHTPIPTKIPTPSKPYKKPAIEDYTVELFPQDRKKIKTTITIKPPATIPPGDFIHLEEDYKPHPLVPELNQEDVQVFDKVVPIINTTKGPTPIINSAEIQEVFDSSTFKPKPAIEETDFDDFFKQNPPTSTITSLDGTQSKIIYSDFFDASTVPTTRVLESLTTVGSTSKSYATSVSIEVNNKNKHSPNTKIVKKLKFRRAKVKELTKDSEYKIYMAEHPEDPELYETNQNLNQDNVKNVDVPYRSRESQNQRQPKREYGLNGRKYKNKSKPTSTASTDVTKAFDDIALQLVNHARTIDYLERTGTVNETAKQTSRTRVDTPKNTSLPNRNKYKRKNYGRVRKVKKRTDNEAIITRVNIETIKASTTASTTARNV